jgi:hypothetical protein
MFESLLNRPASSREDGARRLESFGSAATVVEFNAERSRQGGLCRHSPRYTFTRGGSDSTGTNPRDSAAACWSFHRSASSVRQSS